MAKQRLNRTVRGALAAAAVIAVMGTTTVSATADPAPTTSAQAVQQYKALADQTELLEQKYQKAQDDLKTRQQELSKAKSDGAKAAKDEQAATTQENQYRGQVDQLSSASLQGEQFSKLSALMAGGSTQDYLNRAAALQVISANDDNILQKLSGATNRAVAAQTAASDAQRRAQDATNSANQLIVDLQNQNKVVQQQITTVKSALAKLDPSALAQLNPPKDNGVYIPGSGVAGRAMEIALQYIGVPYVWGGKTPSPGFDCSGLTSWAYNHAGVSIPTSSMAQSQSGQAVSRDQLQPGDLVFFGNPVHHVGMYVGDGKMVDAPNSGELVRIDPLQHDYSGARRVG